MGKSRGRPPFEITPELLAKVEMLGSQGLTQTQIASVIGCALSTLMDKKKNYTEFSEAIKRGQAKGIAKITNKLFQKASEGDNTAMIFYLKNRDKDNWKDRYDNENTSTVTFNAADELKQALLNDRDDQGSKK